MPAGRASASGTAHAEDNERPNSIVTSFNRNFAKRADGNPNTHAFIGVAELVVALTIAGDLTFNPLRDELINESGRPVRLDEPRGDELPAAGFEVKDNGYAAPDPSLATEVVIAPGSQRLQRLAPFAPLGRPGARRLRLLIQASGKCTTDHISMAGPWLRFRGHLENISDNLLMGAVNRFNGRTNSVLNTLDEELRERLVGQPKGYQGTGHRFDRRGRGKLRRRLVARARGLGTPLPERAEPCWSSRSPAFTKRT